MLRIDIEEYASIIGQSFTMKSFRERSKASHKKAFLSPTLTWNVATLYLSWIWSFCVYTLDIADISRQLPTSNRHIPVPTQSIGHIKRCKHTASPLSCDLDLEEESTQIIVQLHLTDQWSSAERIFRWVIILFSREIGRERSASFDWFVCEWFLFVV